MNIVLWIVQAVLALQSFAGGAFKVFQFDAIANMPAMSALPRSGWAVVGVFEMVCGVLLVLPAATGWMTELTALAAAALVVENLALAALYARHSLAIETTNPLVYVVVAALMAAFVAYGRIALLPLV